MALKWVCLQLHQVRICQAFWDNVAGKRNAMHCFQKFNLGNQSICDEPCNGWPQILYDKALKTAIEEGNSQLCGELVERFQVSDKTVRLQVRHIRKTYKLIKCVPHAVSEANNQQRATACFSLLSWHRNVPLFDRMLNSDESGL